MPLQTSAEQPLPVRRVSVELARWIDRLGAIWIEGQVAELKSRNGSPLVWLTLRDPIADMSLQLTVHRTVFDVVDPPVSQGAKVVVHAKAEFFPARGTLSFSVRAIRPVGEGELLARVERTKRLLAAEGLFAPERKRPLPFLPGLIGLVCGRDSAAEHDVVTNARARWPAVRFEVCNVPVQGPQSVRLVIEALQRLDADPRVDVVVLARGGGSLEDLLPFSDEGLVRAVASCRTPVVSAIGHETDTPLVDLAADVRASTPTDAARRLVPDVAEQADAVRHARERLRAGLSGRLQREGRALAELRSRPVLATPHSSLDRRSAELDDLVGRCRRTIAHLLDRGRMDLRHHRDRVRALSPQATLDRGYALAFTDDRQLLRDTAQVRSGDAIGVRLARGSLRATVERTEEAS